MRCEGGSYRHWPQSGDCLETLGQAGGRVGDVSQAWSGRNLHTEEQITGPGGQAGRLLQSWRAGRHTLSHVLLQGAGHTERHLTEPALVDILPHPPVCLHMSEQNIKIINQCGGGGG